MTILGNEPANSYENETLVVIGEDRCNLADKNNIDKNIDKNNVHKKESNDLAACPDITGQTDSDGSDGCNGCNGCDGSDGCVVCDSSH